MASFEIAGKIFLAVLTRLFASSVYSVFIAIIIGGVIGLLSKLILRLKKPVIIPGIFGSFTGTMLVGMLPLFSEPTFLGGGAYTGIAIID